MDAQSSNDPEFVQSGGGIAGIDLSVSGIQAVARRQLIGSVVVAIFLSIVAYLMAAAPVHDNATASAQYLPTVRQPIFVTPASRNIAAMKHKNEVP